MKYIQLITVIFLLQCSLPEENGKAKNQEKKIQEFVPYEIKRDEIITTNPKDFTTIVFEGNFQNDSVKLFTDSKTILNKLINTDHTIGIAYSDTFNFSRTKSVKFQFKNYSIQTLDSLEYYSYLYISKRINSRTVNIQFSYKEKKYK